MEPYVLEWKINLKPHPCSNKVLGNKKRILYFLHQVHTIFFDRMMNLTKAIIILANASWIAKVSLASKSGNSTDDDVRGKIRVSLVCRWAGTWLERGDNGNNGSQIHWHGFIGPWLLALMKKRLPPIETLPVKDLPLARKLDNNSYITYWSDLLAVIDGKADLYPFTTGFHGGLSKGLFNYLNLPIDYFFSNIFYKKEFKFNGDPISDVFDWASYICIGIFFPVKVLLFWIFRKERNKRLQFSELAEIFTYSFGHMFAQGLPDKFEIGRKTKALTTLFLIGTFFIRFFYLSIVITKMTALQKMPEVNSLEDLEQQTHRKILHFGILGNYKDIYQSIGNFWNRTEHIKGYDCYKIVTLNRM